MGDKNYPFETPEKIDWDTLLWLTDIISELYAFRLEEARQGTSSVAMVQAHQLLALLVTIDDLTLSRERLGGAT